MSFIRKYVIRKISFLLSLSIITTVITQTQNLNSQLTFTDITEHVLYEKLTLDAQSIAFYRNIPKGTYYTQTEQITVRAVSLDYDSDPDVFISTNPLNQFPTNSSNSDIACARKGSETCVIPQGLFTINQPIYIGVSCLRKCTYSLKIWFTKTIDITDSNRQQTRLAQASTHILRYFVPEKVQGAQTTSVTLTVEPDSDYTPIDMMFSLNADIYIIEERPAMASSKTGTTLKFSSSDPQWCTKCYIYVVLNIYNEDRYYFTTIARSQNDPLNSLLPAQIYVNPFTQECYPYFLLQNTFNFRVDVQGLSGVADLYIASQDFPSDPTSSRIKIRASQGDQRGLYWSQADKQNYMQTVTGNYYVCFYAYSPFAATISVKESAQSVQNFAYDGQVLTMFLNSNTYKYFIYNSFPTNANGVISIYFELQQVRQGDTLPQVYYTICGNADPTTCSMSNEQALQGKGSTLMIPSSFGPNFGMIDLKVTTSTCPKSGCSFVFSFVNINSNVKVVSIMISSKFQAPADINLDSNYKNSLDEGQYFYYKIDPAVNTATQPWVKSLTIRMRTVRGDADMYFSFNNPTPTQQQSDFRSQTADVWDAITIYDESLTLANNQLNKVLYFSVYANSYTQYFLDFIYETYPVFDQNLQNAIALTEATPIQEVLPTEGDERLYEYRPWWGERENRTIIILADTIVNNILLYGSFDSYPVHFKDTIKDTRDVIAIYGNDTKYNYAGSFYIRARPDFGLQDLLSNRQYIYNMYAFSMTPASNVDKIQNAFETMDLSRDYLGFANNSGRIYQDYRYLQINASAVYNITMRRMPGMGQPIFFVSMLDSNTNNNQAPRALNNHFASQPAPWANVSQQNLTLTSDMRISKSPRCGTIYQSQQGDGNQVCYLAISVTCNSSAQCAWRLRIDIQGVNGMQFQTAQSSTTFTPIPPSPIFTDGFIAGRVSNGQVNYHFIPVDYNKVTEVMILLNKTRIYRSGFNQNGDSMIIANIQSDILEPSKGYNYSNWVYPTINNKGIFSQTNKVTWPEIVQVCNSQMKLSCDGKRGCGIIVGIVGLTKNLWSSYRLKAFIGTNKLQLDNPIKAFTRNTANIAGYNNFDYYWFVINDQAFFKGAQFDYQVSLGVENDGLDPDLYISLMDGREPTQNDYEYKSEIIGADSIRISFSDSIWQQNQWDPTAGVIVVVGVYTPTPMNYNLILTKVVPDNGSSEMNMNLINLGQTVNVKLDQLPKVETIRGYSQLYYMYNWGTKNFDITLSFSQGNGSIMINRVGQLDNKNSLYTGTPKNVNNSRISMDIQEGNYQTISLNGRDCFTCWYFIRVVVSTGNATSFRLTVSERTDSGGQFSQISSGSVTNIVVPNGSFDKRKFMLESMDGWTLNAQIAFGNVNMFVGLNPDTVDSGGHIWQGQSNGQALSVTVRQINDNFYFGTFYYVYFQSTGGQDASLRLTLQQTRSITYIGNNNDFTYQIKHPLFNNWQMSQKFLFQTNRELLKSMVFQVNGTSSSGNPKYHRVNITIRSLTPNFYPVIYLNKIGQNKQATSFSSFTFPTYQNNDFALGQNPFTIINQTRFVFNFTGVTTDPWTYYTMVIYQNTWGLTDQQKSEFSIRINADDVDKCWFFQNCTSYTPIVASSLSSLHETQTLSDKRNIPQQVQTTQPFPDLWSISHLSDQFNQFGEDIKKFGQDLKNQVNALQFLQ